LPLGQRDKKISRTKNLVHRANGFGPIRQCGNGLRPTADTGNPLADALLWVKIPGQSDGQCNRGIAGSTTDPEWAALTGIPGFTDPAAGAWFPQQALQLARLAIPN